MMKNRRSLLLVLTIFFFVASCGSQIAIPKAFVWVKPDNPDYALEQMLNQCLTIDINLQREDVFEWRLKWSLFGIGILASGASTTMLGAINEPTLAPETSRNLKIIALVTGALGIAMTTAVAAANLDKRQNEIRAARTSLMRAVDTARVLWNPPDGAHVKGDDRLNALKDMATFCNATVVVEAKPGQ